MIQTLQFYLSYPFVRYALIVGTLIALCSALLGVTLVLKRFSYIGDGLSHVAFGALAVATIFDIGNSAIVVMPVTVVAAILILRTGQNPRIHGDAAIAMLSVGSLAIGYSCDEFIFHISKYLRGCVQHVIWIDVYTDADKSGGLAVCDIICYCSGCIYLFV